MSMKKSIDNIGNRTRDFPVCSEVPQPSALPRAPVMPNILSKNNNQLRDLRLYLYDRNEVKHLARCVWPATMYELHTSFVFLDEASENLRLRFESSNCTHMYCLYG